MALVTAVPTASQDRYSMDCASGVLGGIKMVYMMRMGQAKYACTQQLSLSEQFDFLAA